MGDESKRIYENALNSLEVAELNLKNEYFNASINRSYYAVFYAATALLAKKGIFTKKHDSTIQQFGLHYVVNGNFSNEISKILSNLFEDREEAIMII